MQTYKQILLTTLFITLPTAIIGMENDTFNYGEALKSMLIAEANKKEMGKHLEKQAECITAFAKKNANNTGACDSEDIKSLGLWLNNKRNSIHEDNAWALLISRLDTEVNSIRTGCYGSEFTITMSTMTLVKKIARNLNPGEDCTQALVQEAEKVVQAALEKEY